MKTEAKPKKLSQVLREARALIATPDKWTQCGGYVADSNGVPSALGDTEACKFCVLGALFSVDGHRSGGAALVMAMPPGRRSHWDVVRFNDSPFTKHEDILALYDRAIAMVDAEEATQ